MAFMAGQTNNAKIQIIIENENELFSDIIQANQGYPQEGLPLML